MKIINKINHVKNLLNYFAFGPKVLLKPADKQDIDKGHSGF
jgi:hypothetical protein